MKEKKDCKIVQDLLPTYIEGLTSNETTEYIEEHLKNCDDCKKVYESMKMEEIQNDNLDTEVDYLKKFNKKLNILRKFIIIIILTTVLMFSISTGRKMMIITNLNNKLNDFAKEDNYYAKATQYGGDTVNVTEKYNSGDNYFSKTTVISMDNNLNKIISNYKNGEQINTYLDTGNAKVAMLNSGGMLNFEPFGTWYQRLAINNMWDLFKRAISSSILNEKCNNKECYRITSKEIFTDEYSVDMIYYIEKETGLPVRYISETTINDYTGDGIIEYQYDIGHVTDEIFEEPDLSEYEIQENN